MTEWCHGCQNKVYRADFDKGATRHSWDSTIVYCPRCAGKEPRPKAVCSVCRGEVGPGCVNIGCPHPFDPIKTAAMKSWLEARKILK